MILKYKRALLPTFLLGVMLLGACKKDFIELLPETSVTPEQALISEPDLLTALRGAYASLRAVDYFGRTVPVLGDVMSDNAYQSLTNSNRYTNFNLNNFTVADANVLGFWRSAYATILRANNIINSSLPSTTNTNQYKGEAYALRALSYFYLIQYFAKPYTESPDALGVPIVLTFDANATPPRAKVSEVYTQIISDLNAAYTNITQFTNSTQFSKYAAKGLQAKVYLTMGDYANARTAALDVINNSGFTLVTATNQATYWNTLTPRTDKLETLLEASSDANANNGFDALPNIYNQSGYGDLLASDELYSLYSATDSRKTLYTTITRGGLAGVAMNGKFPGTFGSELSDTKILRLSEIYLIAAEASVTTNPVDALTYVNAITSRRNALPIASVGAQLFEDIITERRKELAFEGQRYLDLQRLKRDVVRSSNYPAAARAIPYSNYRRILPIPQAELDANPNIRTQQNSGY
ncbi:RagB/SusD family nutrient uptake outer membrane protein [Segetibacter aerophilus]|uniref:Membrane protein n=1 Tax=Segetibacter aerophilus TaxID=670293 RepID=A0A512BJH1_9BACT|nr:RagB/SusD family nutrient uptake outer membrane protein [Segetibacter aerophilus]GEO11967.1 membrane protein [Segetibacter aerophilus]